MPSISVHGTGAVNAREFDPKYTIIYGFIQSLSMEQQASLCKTLVSKQRDLEYTNSSIITSGSVAGLMGESMLCQTVWFKDSCSHQALN